MLLLNLQKRHWISWLVGYRKRRKRGVSLVGEGLLIRMIKLIILMIGIGCSIRSWIDRMANIQPTSRLHYKWPTTQNDHPTTNKYYNISWISHTIIYIYIHHRLCIYPYPHIYIKQQSNITNSINTSLYSTDVTPTILDVFSSQPML